MASETDVVGEVDNAGGRSRSSTVAPRYFCAHDASVAEESEEGAGTPLVTVSAIALGLTLFNPERQCTPNFLTCFNFP